jgi:hypothetical protein
MHTGYLLKPGTEHGATSNPQCFSVQNFDFFVLLRKSYQKLWCRGDKGLSQPTPLNL